MDEEATTTYVSRSTVSAPWIVLANFHPRPAPKRAIDEAAVGVSLLLRFVSANAQTLLPLFVAALLVTLGVTGGALAAELVQRFPG